MGKSGIWKSNNEKNDNKNNPHSTPNQTGCVFVRVTEQCFRFEFADTTNQTRMNVCSCFSTLRLTV